MPYFLEDNKCSNNNRDSMITEDKKDSECKFNLVKNDYFINIYYSSI